MNLRVLIADDESLARERLRELLHDEPGVELVGECASGTEALRMIRDQSPDLVWLDVRMPGLDAFEVMQALGADRLPAIILVTAHDQFAVRAFEEHAVDYLLKPFDRPRFQKALRRAQERLQRGQAPHVAEEAFRLLAQLRAGHRPIERLAVKSGTRVLLIKTDEISWIRGSDNYSELHVGDSVHLLRRTITSLEKELPPNQFLRISRSLIVNMDCIKEIRPKSHGDYFVVLRNGKELSASRSYREGLRSLLGRLE